jgi:murein DD-endopeptidase MepM/ murein hydrolase activator NlpD
MMRAALIALMLAVATPHLAHAQTLSIDVRSRALRPGEAILVTVTAPADASSITITAFGETWPAHRDGEFAWRALIGIDLDRRPGPFAVTATSNGTQAGTVRRTLTVLPAHFRRRVLRVAPDYVNPPPDLLARITSEAAFTRDLYEHSASEPAWRAGFLRPVREPANSAFGSRSVFNGEPRSPHAGTDFLSPAGTVVHAPASGRIVAARDLFFTGNTVIIDHGAGVFSMLAHLSRLDVHEGQDISAGEPVGLVGATGRVTGPHLHWALRIGGARVDALSVLALLRATP